MRHFIHTLIIAGIGLLSTTVLLAQQQPPAGSEPKPFSLPDIESYVLDNGLSVTMVPYGNVPKVSISAVIHAGNVHEGNKPYVADLLAEMLKEGSGDMDGAALARQMAEFGGSLNINVGLDGTSARMDILSENAAKAVGLLANVLTSPSLPEAEFVKARTNLANSVTVAKSRPQTIASDAYRATVYPDHPLGAETPSAEVINANTLADVQAFYRQNFNAKRTRLYVVGQFDRNSLRSAINKHFSEWKSGNKAPSLPSTPNQKPAVVLIDRAGAPQSTIRFGQRVNALDSDVKLEAVNTMLGGYFSSRITRNIREDKGYTYSPSSRLATSYGARDWQQTADITSESTGPAITEIIKEIRGLQTTEPGVDEVNGIKNYMNGIFVIRLASRGGMVNQLSFVDLHGLGSKYLENYVSNVQALTAADFKNTAIKSLSIDDMNLVVVGDLATVRDQLEVVSELKDRLPSSE